MNLTLEKYLNYVHRTEQIGMPGGRSEASDITVFPCASSSSKTILE